MWLDLVIGILSYAPLILYCVALVVVLAWLWSVTNAYPVRWREPDHEKEGWWV